jgi:ubiquinone/menaquinone biosynthesis C-methylase UbiE
VNVYGRIFARFYDRMLAATEEAGLAAERGRALQDARGRVLEIGAGTGLNLERYPAQGVEELVLAEPEEPMARRLRERVAEERPGASVVVAPAETLPFEDDSFDTVVSTLVLCTVDDPARALGEVRRVLKPGGRLLFVEHVRSETDPKRARWQDRLAPIWKQVGHGCRCNRRTLAEIEGAGLLVEQVTDFELPKSPGFVRPAIRGRAVAPAP